MSRVEDIIAVIGIACLTEDRTNDEQLALLRIARWVDREANKNTAQNKWMWGPNAGTDSAVRQRPMVRMEEQVDQTRDVSDFPGDKQREVHLPARRPKKVGAPL